MIPRPQSAEPRLAVPDVHIASAHMKLSRAHWAVMKFGKADRQTVLRVAEAVARTAHEKAGFYADWAVRETGFGVAEHKKIKNEFSALPLLDFYRDQDLVSPRLHPDTKIIELPKPAGVIFALTPATNPVSTLYYKTLLAILSRNAVVFSPHPLARECSIDAAATLARAAEDAGAPSGLIQCVEQPSVHLVKTIMASDQVSVIMATGGGAMVRAAYSSGNPALGVGPGNAVAYVDPSASADKAARRLVESKNFDNSVLCTNESVVLALDSNKANLERALRSAGAYVCNAADTDRLRNYLFTDQGFNIAAIGKSAVWIADKAGIRVASGARILVPVIEAPGQDDPLLCEKLCPVLTLASAVDFSQALNLAAQIARRGAGHSAAFHGDAPDRLLEFSQKLPVYRVVVNAPCSQGAAGFATHLPPAFMIGTGFKGRSSVGENVGPQHLVHWTRIAYGKDDPVNFDHLDLSVLVRKKPRHTAVQVIPEHRSADDMTSRSDSDRDMLRRLILEELRNLEGERR